MTWHKVAVAVDDLAAIVDGAAEARTLTHIEHCAAQIVHMLAEARVARSTDESGGGGGGGGTTTVVHSEPGRSHYGDSCWCYMM